MDRKNVKKDEKMNSNKVRIIMLWNIIFLSCLTIAALLFAMFVFFRLRVRGTDGIRKFYSDAQLRSIREEAAERERQIILAKMRDSLESGQGTTLMLRQVFSDQMVVVSEGKYYFYPVKEDVEKNIIPSGMLICEDGKTVEYKGSYPSMTLSHGALISDDNGRIDWDRLSQSDVSELTIRAGKLRSGGFDPDRQFERNYEEAGKRNIPVMLCLEVDKPCSESVLSRAVDEMMSLISRVESSGEESAEKEAADTEDTEKEAAVTDDTEKEAAETDDTEKEAAETEDTEKEAADTEDTDTEKSGQENSSEPMGEAEKEIEAASGAVEEDAVTVVIRIRNVENISDNEKDYKKWTDTVSGLCKILEKKGLKPMVGGSIHTFAAQLDITGAAEYDRWLIDHEMAVSFPYSISCWEYSRDGRLNGVPGDALLYARIQLRE